jgi:hypothetical protein
MKNYQAILVVVCSFYVFFGVLNGTIQQYIYFADPLNEIFVAAIAGTMGLLGLTGIDYKKLFNALK